RLDHPGRLSQSHPGGERGPDSRLGAAGGEREPGHRRAGFGWAPGAPPRGRGRGGAAAGPVGREERRRSRSGSRRIPRVPPVGRLEAERPPAARALTEELTVRTTSLTCAMCAGLLIASAGAAAAGGDGAGTTAANFLMVGSGARALGMGGVAPGP